MLERTPTPHQQLLARRSPEPTTHDGPHVSNAARLMFLAGRFVRCIVKMHFVLPSESSALVLCGFCNPFRPVRKPKQCMCTSQTIRRRGCIRVAKDVKELTQQCIVQLHTPTVHDNLNKHDDNGVWFCTATVLLLCNYPHSNMIFKK